MAEQQGLTELQIALLKRALARLLLYGSIGVIYFVVTAEGMRVLLPILAQKLHAVPLPFFGLLRYFATTRVFDLGHLLAAVFLFAVAYSWERMLLLLLDDETCQRQGWNAEAYRSIMQLLSAAVLGADGLLFYVGAAHSSWGGDVFSFGALVISVGYVSCMVAIALLVVSLDQRVVELERSVS